MDDPHMHLDFSTIFGHKWKKKKTADSISVVPKYEEDEYGNYVFDAPMLFDELPENVKEKAIENNSEINVEDRNLSDGVDDWFVESELQPAGIAGKLQDWNLNPIDSAWDFDVKDYGLFAKALWKSLGGRARSTWGQAPKTVFRALIEGNISVWFSHRDMRGSGITGVEDYTGLAEQYPRVRFDWDSALETLKDACESYFMDLESKFATSMNKQYEYLKSRESIIETLRANEYTFNEQGKIDSAMMLKFPKTSDMAAAINAMDVGLRTISEFLSVAKAWQVWEFTKVAREFGRYLFIVDPQVKQDNLERPRSYYRAKKDSGVQLAHAFWSPSLDDKEYAQEWHDEGQEFGAAVWESEMPARLVSTNWKWMLAGEGQMPEQLSTQTSTTSSLITETDAINVGFFSVGDSVRPDRGNAGTDWVIRSIVPKSVAIENLPGGILGLDELQKMPEDTLIVLLVSGRFMIWETLRVLDSYWLSYADWALKYEPRRTGGLCFADMANVSVGGFDVGDRVRPNSVEAKADWTIISINPKVKVLEEIPKGDLEGSTLLRMSPDDALVAKLQYQRIVHYISFEELCSEWVSADEWAREYKPLRFADVSAVAVPPQAPLKVVTHPEYYDFTADQGDWQMNQYRSALDALHQQDGRKNYQYVEPEPATAEDARAVHTPEYVADVFGPPAQSHAARQAWSHLWDASAQKAVLRSAGGMIRANDEALKSGVAVQLYDAFHHAYPNHGEGFCVLNDVAMAAKKVSTGGKRVMVVDTDVHQGQGTAVCTAGDPNIYTLSTHERENYPAHKEHSSQDVELENGVTDEMYLAALSTALEKAVAEFGAPDLVMYIAGTDLFKKDRLSNTRITLEGIQQRDQLVFKFFGERGVPISVSIPQGYSRDAQDTQAMIVNTLRESRAALKYYQGRASASLCFADVLGLPELQDEPGRRIRTSYTMTTPASVAQGDYADHGWADEEGVEITADMADMDDDLYPSTEAYFAAVTADKLRDMGAIEYGNNNTYYGEFHVADYQMGEQKQLAFHLTGFTLEELSWVAQEFRAPARQASLTFSGDEEYDTENKSVWRVCRERRRFATLKIGTVDDDSIVSDQDVETSPSEAQIESGNYKKGHVRLHGLDITIENPKGSTRRGEDARGNKWSIKMKSDYGYLKGFKGKDKDELDIVIGEHVDSEFVYVVNQKKKGGRGFDEHKVVLGTHNEEDAQAEYLGNYDKNWLSEQGGTLDGHAMTVQEFKDWLENGDTKKPVTPKVVKETMETTADAANIVDDMSDVYGWTRLIGTVHNFEFQSWSLGSVYTSIRDYVYSHTSPQLESMIVEHGYYGDSFVNALPIRIVAGSPADEELTFCAYLLWDDQAAVMEIDVPVMQARRDLRLTHSARAAVAQPIRDQLDYPRFANVNPAQITWEPRVRSIIEQGGGRYKGIQDYGAHGIFVFFDETETGSTCMSLVQQITPEFVAQKLQETRKKFDA
jgi:acetoin utilization deacetylase AcuC-like enzyme